MKRIHILISDSVYTTEIAASIGEYFGDKVLCFEESVPPNVKIDIFILSGFNLLNTPDMAIHRKNNEGSSDCKAIAISMLGNCLDEIDSRPELAIDRTIHKKDLIRGFIDTKTRAESDAYKILEEVVTLFS